jgi:hypothetical protein
MNIEEIFGLPYCVILLRLLIFNVYDGLIYIVVHDLINVCDDITTLVSISIASILNMAI